MNESSITGESESPSHIQDDDDDGEVQEMDDQGRGFESDNDDTEKESRLNVKVPRIEEDVSNNCFLKVNQPQQSVSEKHDESEIPLGSVTDEMEYKDVCVKDEDHCGCQDIAYKLAKQDFEIDYRKKKGCTSSALKSRNLRTKGIKVMRAEGAKNLAIQKLKNNMLVQTTSRHGLDLTSVQDWMPFYRRYKGIRGVYEEDDQPNKFCGVSGCYYHLLNVYKPYRTTTSPAPLHSLNINNDQMKIILK